MTRTPDPRPPLFTRRAALRAAAATVAATAPIAARAETPAAADVCRLTPEAVEGPFYYDPALVRSELAEGRPGVPLELRLAFIDAATCAPLPGVRADIWHCDATGGYSGFGTRGGDKSADNARTTFLRGTQFADAQGRVAFRTIYPGWYSGRTPHIHLKALVDARAALTTQLYFPDALSEYIYGAVEAYRRPERRDTVNAGDFVLSETPDGRSTFLNIREEADRYVATLTIAVDRNATSSTGGRMPPPPPDRPGSGPRPEAPRGPLVPGEKV